MAEVFALEVYLGPACNAQCRELARLTTQVWLALRFSNRTNVPGLPSRMPGLRG